MTRNRINILGASGCGATSTGKALAEKLCIPHFDSDDYYHEPTDPPFQRQRTPQQRHDLIMSDLSHVPGWILSGGVANWEPYPQLDFTLMVFIRVQTPIRIERLRRRESARFGARILPGGDMHENHAAFIEWASRYDQGDVEGKTLPRHEAYLARQTCPVLRLSDPATTSDAVDAVLAMI